MKNNIILCGENFSGKSKLIRDIFIDLGALLRIHGYFQVRNFKEKKEVEAIYYSFRTRKQIFSFDLLHPDDDKQQLDELHSLLLPELSLFPNPDLFLIDEIGNFESSSDRIHQQFKTIFGSRIAVIAAVSTNNLSKIDPLLSTVEADVLDFTPAQSDLLHLEILKRLR